MASKHFATRGARETPIPNTEQGSAEDTAVAQWRAMTPAQQAAKLEHLKDLRERVNQLPPFENQALESERQHPGWMPRALCQEYPEYLGAEAPLEIRTLERLLSPTAAAWERAIRHVRSALRDDQLRCDPIVLSIFEKMEQAVLDHTWDDLATPENVLRFLIDPLAEKRARTNGARHAAMAKNESARDWVRNMWASLKQVPNGKGGMPVDIAEGLESARLAQRRPRPTITKKLFGEYMAKHLSEGYGDQVPPTTVDARTIQTLWLEGL